jgi:RNA polymerase sigma-70 factor, ECF subfamily
LLALRRAGDEGAKRELFEMVYALLRVMARRAMRRQPAAHTLQPTAVANEVYLRLAGSEQDWTDEVHLRAILANAVRCVLADHARRKHRRRRAAPGRRVAVDWHTLAVAPPPEAILALDEALEVFAATDPRAAKVVELRYYGGLSMPEVARVLGVSLRTVERDWGFARAWLLAKLS